MLGHFKVKNKHILNVLLNKIERSPYQISLPSLVIRHKLPLLCSYDSFFVVYFLNFSNAPHHQISSSLANTGGRAEGDAKNLGFITKKEASPVF